MKILVAFLFLQLAAGISCSDATGRNTAAQAMSFLLTYNNILGNCRLDGLDRKDAAVKQAVIDKCKKNGGPAAYDDAKEGLQILLNSVNSALNDTFIQSRTLDYESFDEDEHIPILCDRFRNVMNLTKPALDSVRPCLDEEERASADAMYNIKIAATDFICGNNGSNLISFYRTGGFGCLVGQSREYCSSEPPHNNNSTVVISAQLAGQPWSYQPSFPGVNDCKYMQKAKSCVLKRFSGCQQSEPSNLTISLFDAVEKVSGCDNILKAQESSAA